MGEIADMILEGLMCQYCGEILDGKGYPTACEACQKESNADEFVEPLKKKINCPKCNRRVAEKGLSQHMADKHQENQ